MICRFSRQQGADSREQNGVLPLAKRFIVVSKEQGARSKEQNGVFVSRKRDV